jgi:CBS domain-containing protein
MARARRTIDWEPAAERPLGRQSRPPASGVRAVRLVRDAMTWPAAVVGSRATAYSVERLAHEGGFHHFPVLEGRELVGMLCICDLWTVDGSAEIHTCMSAPAVSVPSGASLMEAARIMDVHDIDSVPTLWLDMWGVLTRGDLVRAGVCDEADRPRCYGCDGWHHVRPSRAWPDRYCCLECRLAGEPGADGRLAQ